MTIYQDDIDAAQELIAEMGQFIVIQREPEDPEVVTYDETDYGPISASNNEIVFALGDVSDIIEVGDTVSFREISAFKNRGPLTVSEVGTSHIKVDEDLDTSEEDTWFMDVSKSAASTTAGVGVPLPPQSVTKQQFEQAFRDGTLQISRAKDLILAAKELEFDPKPGDKIQLGHREWQANEPAWLIHGIGPVDPDGTAIIWQGIMMRG